MEIYNLDKTEKLPKLEICCAAIGNFDGLHLAHKELIKKTKEFDSFKSLVITFDYINKDDNKLISLEDRIEMIKKLNVDYLIILKYEDFKMMFYYEFIKMLKKLKVKKVVIGKDFRFGFKKEGDYIDLENKLEVSIVDDLKIKEEKISTTTIKNKLKSGDIKTANLMLGYNFFIEGIVKKGSQLGRTINFPTANIHTKTILKPGVYYTKTTVDGKKFKSMTNIGLNPTFNEQKNLKIETTIHDFDKNIYGKKIKVEFIEFLREEKKFDNVEQLVDELNRNYEEILQKM